MGDREAMSISELCERLVQRMDQKRELATLQQQLLRAISQKKMAIEQVAGVLSSPDDVTTICPNKEVQYDTSTTCPSSHWCAGTGAYDCREFSCDDSYSCNSVFDFACGKDFSCIKDHSCTGGHGFFCTETNDCIKGFDCKGGGMPCDNVHRYRNVTGGDTPGDFICGIITGTFGCRAKFTCNSVDQFECPANNACTGESSAFTCGSKTIFDCGTKATDFVCNSSFSCQSKVNCTGSASFCTQPA